MRSLKLVCHITTMAQIAAHTLPHLDFLDPLRFGGRRGLSSFDLLGLRGFGRLSCLLRNWLGHRRRGRRRPLKCLLLGSGQLLLRSRLRGIWSGLGRSNLGILGRLGGLLSGRWAWRRGLGKRR